MKTLAERLVWARNEKGLSQQELADGAGVSQSTIGNLEAGIRSTARKITSIAATLGVDAIWLAEGLGSPYSPGSSSGLPKGAIPVREYDEDNGDYVAIKTVKLKLSAGISGFAVEPDRSEAMPIVFQREWLARNGYQSDSLVAVKIRGESMRPKFDDGDVVVINTADKTLKDDLVFAINFDGEDVIKRVKRVNREWWLYSDNSDQKTYHPHICKTANCIIIGRVVHMQSRNFGN